MNTVKDDSILLSYTYTIEKPKIVEVENLYKWELQQWSACDALCHGNSFRTAVCVNVVIGLKVTPQFCEQSSKLPAEYRKCNMECSLS